MYGKNPVRHQEHEFKGTYQVAEIFSTIQGEGPYSGRPAIFIRLTGCNLRCWFCDTQWDDEKDPHMDLDAIKKAVLALRAREDAIVVLTGGEPLRQPLAPLISLLMGDLRRDVQIETAGTLWQPWIGDGNWWKDMYRGQASRIFTIVCSPKTPKINETLRPHIDYWKYPLKAGSIASDGLSIGTARPTEDDLPWTAVFVTPVDEPDAAMTAANIEAVGRSAMVHGHTAQVQLHKILRLR